MKARSSKALFLIAGALVVLFLGLRFSALFGSSGDNPVVLPPPEVPSLTSRGDIAKTDESLVRSSLNFERVARTLPPQLSAKAALVADPMTGEVLFGMNQDVRWPIASLTKLMSAVVVKENMSGTASVTLAPPDFASGGNSLTQILAPGDRYSKEDALRLMLVASSNEAAEAFARTYGREAFLSAMNAKAKSWGLSDTHFADPSGVAAGNQSTTRDMSVLVTRIFGEYPGLFVASRALTVSLTDLDTGTVKTLQNIDQLAGRVDFLGGKTGTTPEAGENLVALFSFRSRPVMILIFGSSERYADAERLKNWFTNDFSPSN